MSGKTIAKRQAELEDLLAQKTELEAHISADWDQLRMLRIAAIRGDNDPGPLPFFLGLDEQWRNGQQRQEQLARQHREADQEAANDPILRGAA
jgi:hypothetical protein